MNYNRNTSQIGLWIFVALLLLVPIGLFLFILIDSQDDISLGIPQSISRLMDEEPETPEDTPYTPPQIQFEGDVVNLAWFYKPPSDGDVEKLANHYNTFILTKKDEETRDALFSNGVTRDILQYYRFDAIMNPGACDDQPKRNQVADQIGDYCWISEQHPDWFLLDLNGNRMETREYVMMDPGNQGWREFWLQRVMQNQQELGWHGVFIDNVEASFSKRESRGQLPAKYLTVESYQAEIRGFLEYIYTNYFFAQQRPLLANIIAVDDEAIWFEYLQFLDGVMEEAWAVGWGNDYRSVIDWQKDLTRAERAQEMGKSIILVSQGEYADINRQNFAFASYLLITYGNASFRYIIASAYDQNWLYNIYDIGLGEPLGPRYILGDKWARDFSGGTVIVDPDDHTATIETK